MKISALLGLAFLCNFLFADVLLPPEKDLIFELLQKNQLESNDLNFLKDWSSDTKYKLPIVLEILQNPLHFPVFVDSIQVVAKKADTAELLTFFSNQLYAHQNTERDTAYFQKLAENIYKEKDIFIYVEKAWEKIEEEYDKAFGNINESDWEKLTYFAYAIYSEPEDSLSYQNFFEHNNIAEFEEIDLTEISLLIDSIDFHALMEAASLFQTGFSVLQKAIPDKRFSWEKQIEKETKWGIFCIGSKNNDIYRKDFAFLLDPGGNDSYFGKISTNKDNPFYWIWDFAGTDTYYNAEIAGLFSVFFGLGIHEDSSGTDFYHGGDYSFSSLFGFQQHTDKTGDDSYTSGLHSLGAGTCGISLLLNIEGNDFYSTSQMGEGFGGVLGAGILLDATGNDIYFAGGKYKHAPLAPDDYRSLGQGFGFGLRPDFAGGIGILCDAAGNDYYNGGVYAQGVAYWYALGILIDESGNDFYNAVYYPQGSGIHLAGGFLFDKEGDDHYYSKHGPGQGAGHDYAVGFFIDRAGNDIYSVEGGNGLGLTNSVGIFLDAEGNDRYERNFSSNYGYANTARDAGGIGLFLDLAGNDFYPMEYTKNDTTWNRGIYGIGLDSLFTESRLIPEEENISQPVDSTATIEELFSIASDWAVGENQKRVEKARKILLEREEETADFIFREKLGTKSGLTYRALENFTTNSKLFIPLLKNALNHEDSLYVKNAISLLAKKKDLSVIPDFQNFLEQNKYVSTILAALGNYEKEEALSLLIKYKNSNSEKLRVITARSLKKMNTDKSIKYLLEMKNDDSFLIKSMIQMMEKRDETK